MVDIATLGIAVDSRQVVAAQSALNRFTPAARRAETATRSLGAASATASAFMRSFLPALGAGLLARGGQAFLDASTRITNSLKVAGLEGANLTVVYDRLFESAQRNVAPLEALTELYSRAALVQRELGITTEELLGFTDKVAVALRVSGKSAAESSGALLQLSQALGSGVVRAEEFNSILEGALPIAQAAAAGLEEAGGSVAKLRQLVVDGAISSEAFFRAFEAGAVILDEKVAGAELTVSQGFIRLQNVLIDAAGRFDDTTGASDLLTGSLGLLADAIEGMTNVMEIALAKDSLFVTMLRNHNDAVNGLGASYNRFLNNPTLWNFWDMLFVGSPTDPVTQTLRGQAAAVDQLRESLVKMGATSDTVGGAAAMTADQLVKMEERFATAFNTRVRTVSLKDYAAPDSKDDKAAARALRDAERRQRQIDDVIKSLAFEEAQLGRTNREQEIYNALNAAGVDLTSSYGQQIAEAAGRLYDLTEAQEAYRDMLDTAQDLTRGFFSDLTNGLRRGENLFDALTDAVGRLANKLLDMAMDQAINGLFQNLMGSFNVMGNTGLPNAFPGVSMVSPSVGVFHSGGVAGVASTFRNIHPAYFDDAPRYHSGGIAGLRPNEVPAILERGERIIPRNGSAGGVTVNVINAPAGTTATATQRKGPDGNLTVDVLLKQVEDVVSSAIDSGESPINKSMERRYEMRPAL